MKWISLLLIHIVLAICNEDENTKALVNYSPKESEHVSVPDTTTHIVFLNFSGTLYPETLSEVKNLEELTFQDVHFDEIKPGSLCQSPKLKLITFNSVVIEKLENKHFENCGTLKKLEIRYHNFPIGPNTFEDLGGLVSLLTAQFNWGQLKKGDFNGLENVKEISLTTGNIEKIEPGTFEELENLESLILRNNKIPVIEGTEFRGLSSLKTLDVDSNPIKSVDIDELLKNLPKLKTFNVSPAFLSEDDIKNIKQKLSDHGASMNLA